MATALLVQHAVIAALIAVEQNSSGFPCFWYLTDSDLLREACMIELDIWSDGIRNKLILVSRMNEWYFIDDHSSE